ncbi:uncharacterized protein LOC144422153 isoform X2 [Styela clava]
MQVLISSVGEYESVENLWTHNVSGVMFTAVFDSCVIPCSVSWRHSMDGAQICFETMIIILDERACTYDDVVNNTCSGKCDFVGNKTNTNFTISSPFIADGYISLIHSNSTVLDVETITVRYCDALTSTQEALNIIGGENASFMNVAEYSCNKRPGVIVVDDNYNNTFGSYNRTCGYKPHWNGSGNVSCSYAPSPELEISNSTYYQKKYQYYVTETIKLNCTGDLGFPEVEKTDYVLTPLGGNMEIVSSDLSLSLTYDWATIWCEASNKYTLLVNTTISSIESNKITINVLYPPTSSFIDRTEVVSVGHNLTLWFFFTSNPPVDKEDLTLTFATYNGTDTNLPDNIMPVQNYSNGKKQNFTYEIINVTKSNLGKYSLEVRSTDPVQQNEILNMFVELTDIPYTTNAPETPNSTPASIPLEAVIGGAIAGLLILVVIIVYFLVKFRRNESSATEKASDKEEKDNPLYGTTARDGGAAVVYAADKTGHASSSKEERLNPLYDSNSATQGGVEEAYAAVDVRKKKKKNKADKGNENAAFSSESNAAVYAAVDKSKKKKNDKPPVEAVYSEVNKKKGSKNDTTLHGSSQ